MSHSLHTIYDANYVRVVGAVDTVQGIVRVDAWYDNKPCVRLEIIIDGVEYCRYYNRKFSNRYIVTLARRLGHEATEFHSDPEGFGGVWR